MNCMWQAVTGRTTLSFLLEMLAEAAAMGAGKSDLMDKLQLRADSARAFEAKAAPCLATVEASAEAVMVDAEPATSTTPVDASGASVDRVDTSAAAVSTSSVDTPAVGMVPTGVTTPSSQKISLAELESLVQEGHSIGVKLDSPTDLTRLMNSARTWSQQAEYCLTGREPHPGKTKKHHPRPSLDKVTDLVSQLPTMAVTLPHAAELCERQHRALNWVDRARQVLEQGNLHQNLPEVQAIVEAGTALGLEMPELTHLDSLVKAIQWNTRVRTALSLHPEASRMSLQLPAGQEQLAPSEAQCCPVQPVQPSLGDGLGPAGGLVSQGSSAPVVPYTDRLSLAEAEALCEQGGLLPVEERLLQRLQELMQAGQQWGTQVNS